MHKCRRNVDICTLVQGSPTLGLRTSTCPWSVSNSTTQQIISEWWVSKQSSICICGCSPYRSRYHLSSASCQVSGSIVNGCAVWTPNCPPPQSAENDLPWSQPQPKSLGTLLWWILHSPWCVSSQCQGRVWKKHCCGAWATGAQGMVPKPHLSLPLGGHNQGAWSCF